jgi:predicted Ser/Thr protein kinase
MAPNDLTTDARAPEVIPPAFAPGAVVAGRYRLESRLGAGGGGTVWRAFDQQLGAMVALKIVSSDGDIERWRREVAMARRIADRNVCRVHDLGEAGDVRFVTMELVEGTSLRAKIDPALPAAEACDLVQQIVAGAAAIHAAGVVHRDLKPENIVVATDGRAVIVDFGLAREPSHIAEAPTVRQRGSATVTNTGTVVGTPRYMAPEQAAGQVVDARADVWALGLIAHELLAGALPVGGAPRASRSGGAVGGGAASATIDPAVDAKWPDSAPILRRCLGLLPDERFADARTLQAALAATRRGRWVRPVANALALAGCAGALALANGLVRAERAAPPALARRIVEVAPAQWPDEAPLSVALAPDARRFAYTTAGGKLYVRDLDGTMPPVAWPTPKVAYPSLLALDAPELRDPVTMWAAGWLGDGALALVGTTRDNAYLVYRVRERGEPELLARFPEPVLAAAAAERLAIATREAVLVGDASVATLAPGERVSALAWSPDGTRLAVARAAPGQPAKLELLAPGGGGGEPVTAWEGAGPVALVSWLAADRLVLAAGGTLLALDATDHATAVERYRLRGEGPPSPPPVGTATTGPGSAARGVLVFVSGAASERVQVTDRYLWRPQPVHDSNRRARMLAGWTSDARVVFLAGEPGDERVVRGAPGEVPVPWPGTLAGDVPDTLVDDGVIVHRIDAAARTVAIALVDRAGARKELARLPLDKIDASGTPVRCAGDRTAPCLLEERTGGEVSYVRFDPATGALGDRVHARGVREPAQRSAALSPDGTQLAIVDGGDQVTVIDVATLEPRLLPAGAGAELRSLAFDAAGNLWVTGAAYRGRLFGVLKFDRLASGRMSTMALGEGGLRGDALRMAWRPSVSPDGKRVALSTRELRPELWRADGL